MIEVVRHGNAVVFRVKETQLQMYAIPQFKAAVTSQLVDKPKLVIFDMTLVEHVDSSAMGALFHIQKELKTWDGKLRVAHLTNKVMQIFKITKSENAFEICATVEEALKGS
jgi:anti-sigma B factor antagonist